MLRVRALGFAEYNAVVTLASDSTDVPVQLRPIVATLGAVNVTDSLAAPWMREFEDRRRRGTGRYITADEIRASHGASIGALLERKLGRVRVHAPNPLVASVFSMRGPNTLRAGCQVAVFLDGHRVFSDNAAEVPLAMLAGMEYYTPGTIPVQYRSSADNAGRAACGALLLWTGP